MYLATTLKSQNGILDEAWDLHRLHLVCFRFGAGFPPFAPTISALTLFNRSNSTIHSGSVRLFTVGTLTVLSSHSDASLPSK